MEKVTVHGTTAQFPGLNVWDALNRLHNGVSEGFWGLLSTNHIQICPQTHGVISEQVAEDIVAKYPLSNIRLHANARVLPKFVIGDISSWGLVPHEYFVALADRMKRLGSSCISLHAGYQNNCDASTLWDNMSRIQDLMDDITSGSVEVAIEGLYPSTQRPQWLGTWAAYEELLWRNRPFALDLSHLKIVKKQEGLWPVDLVNALITSPWCREIHVSENDGTRDHHLKAVKQPVWWSDVHPSLLAAQPQAVVFSEGNLLPRRIHTTP